jgi:hypothetical protein
LGGRISSRFLWSGPDLECLLRSWFGGSIRNRRKKSLGGDWQSVLLDLSPGSSSGLHEDFGVQLGFELFILLLKSGGPSAIAGVLDGNRLNAHSLDIKDKPHSMTLELLGSSGQRDTWLPAEWISGRGRWEPEYRRT